MPPRSWVGGAGRAPPTLAGALRLQRAQLLAYSRAGSRGPAQVAEPIDVRGRAGQARAAAQRPARVEGADRPSAPTMASKCPKCDKTVYFGEYPPAVCFLLQAPGAEPHPVVYTDWGAQPQSWDARSVAKLTTLPAGASGGSKVGLGRAREATWDPGEASGAR